MKYYCTLLFLLMLSFRIMALPVSKDKRSNRQPYGYWENKGQVVNQDGVKRSDILYYFEENGFTLALGKDFFSYQITTSINDASAADPLRIKEEQTEVEDPSVHDPFFVKMERTDVKLLGAGKEVKITASRISLETRNFYTPAGVYTGVHNFQKIVYENIYPLIDLAFYIEPASASEKARLKYDFIIHPGGDVSAIQLFYAGPTLPAINAEGELVSLLSQTGFIKESRPLSYFQSEADSFFIPYQSNGSVISFNAKKAKNKKVLTIDPEINWGRYIGNIKDEFIEVVEVDGSGNIYCCGQTSSPFGVVTSGAYQTIKSGSYDCFIAKVSSSGAMDWCTYFGGENEDYALGLNLDGFGHFYLCGQTKSLTVMATEGSYQETYAGVHDGFISKFDTTGILIWSTYFGGTGKDQAFACVSDQTGVYISGYTESPQNIATDGAEQAIYAGAGDAFIAGFSPDGSILFATYLGGNDQDRGHDLVMDHFGNLMVTGTTPSASGIALGDVHQTEVGGNTDAFVGKFSKTGKKKWCTYYGSYKTDRGREIVTDGVGNSYVSGSTASGLNMATADAHQTLLNGIGPASGYEDAYLLKLDSSGKQVWATYFGGAKDDIGSCIKWLPNGLIFIAGATLSNNLISTPDAFQTSCAGKQDAFIAIFTEEGHLIWSSYYGGSQDEVYANGYGPAFDIYEQREFFFGVSTSSAGLATLNSYSPSTTTIPSTDALLVDFDLECLDRYEPNNSFAKAYNLSDINETVAIDALINYAGDKDYFSFTKTSDEWPLKITLSDLAVNCDLFLYDSFMHPVKKSHHAGLGNEEITINPTLSGKFYLQVSNPGVGSSHTCYHLSIENMDGIFKLPPDEISADGLVIYPNPAKDACTLFINSETTQQTSVRISDITGKMVREQFVSLVEGENEVAMNITSLHSGAYFISVVNSGVSVKKLIVY